MKRKVVREKVLRVLAKHKPELARMGVRSIGLFGSAARGKSETGSDLDFLVEFDRKSFDAYMDVKEFLEELFGCKADVVIAENLKPRLKPTILGETVYASRL